MHCTSIAVLISCLWVFGSAQKNNHFYGDRNTIVHLFEWKWDDIAAECENFLAPHGYAGVQISPPNENLVIKPRPWWERYQPVSYILKTRSGDEDALASMVKRCNAVNVRIYVDSVINHMTASNGTGTADSTADRDHDLYPGVPYGPLDFHPECAITNYSIPDNVRNCELDGLRDLDQSKDYVRGELVGYFNHLVDLGVAGFRVDAAKHMDPEDLGVIYSTVKNLNTDVFPENSRPFIYQEVIDKGTEPITKQQYTGIGTVLEFMYGLHLGNVFQGGDQLWKLESWGRPGAWELLDGSDAVAFIDNHDNQRHDEGGKILTYKKPKQYKMALAFMLAHPYGTTRIMSSFAFDDADQGPPQDADGNLVGPGFNPDDNTCTNGYVCEHRWRQIYNMVGFRNAVSGSKVDAWWSNGDQQIAFSRGNNGFVAFTQYGDINETIQTSLPPGTYCDVISGGVEDGECTGKSVTVADDGSAFISLSADGDDGFLAIHAEAKLWN